MSRFLVLLVAALLVAFNTVDAFTVSRPMAVRSSTIVSRTMAASDEESSPAVIPKTIERGVSVDQDGKSNVWAIEPKVELDTRSSEEKTGSALLGVGGFAAFAAAAAVILTNLPDPDQF